MPKVTLKTEPNCKRILEIEIPQAEVATELEAHFAEYRSKANIPGFRPGKAPLDIVKKRFADNIKAEVIEELIGKAIDEAIKQENLWPITRPKVLDIDFTDDKPLSFKAEIEVKPQFDLKDYSGFSLTRDEHAVTDTDVESYLKELHKRSTEFIPVERKSNDNDLVVIDLLKKTDSLGKIKDEKTENLSIELDSTDVLKEFKEGLRGTGVGEMKDIEVTYPADYGDKALAGNKVKYLVVVKEVKEKKLAPLDDEFAKTFGHSADLETLKKNIRDSIAHKAKEDADTAIRNEIIKKVVDNNKFDVPESMVEKYLNSVTTDFKKRYKDVDELKLKQSYRPVGEDNLRWQFLYYEIAQKEGISVNEEDRTNWVRRFAQAYNVSEEEARENLGRAHRFDDIDDSILENKVLDFLTKNAKITNK
jgi:trigger factor